LGLEYAAASRRTIQDNKGLGVIVEQETPFVDESSPTATNVNRSKDMTKIGTNS